MKHIEIALLFYLLFLLTLSNLLFAQEPDTLWTKLIGGDSMDVAYDVEELWDGGFAIVGYTKSIPLTDYDIWLLRTDSNGDTLWTRTYGGDGVEYGYSLKKADDGGFIISGVTDSYGAGGLDFYLIRTDSLGDTLWTRTFGGINDDICWSVDNSLDGGFVMAGEKDAFPETPDAMVVKVNSLGQLEWERIYGSFLINKAHSIRVINTGELLISGTYQILGVNEDGWLLKLNSDGDSLWSKFFGGAFIDEFFLNNTTSDLGNILVGSHLPSLGDYPDLFLVKTDSLGNEQWSKTLDYDNDGDIGYSAQQTSDGGYIITGEARPLDGTPRVWVVRSDSLGNILWDKFIQTGVEFQNKGPIRGADRGYSIKQTVDGGYIVAGYKSAQTTIGYQFQVYLIKIASDIIPVELTSFVATTQQNNVTLNWQTATETNNSGFEIERTSPLPSPYEGEGVPTIRDGRGWNVIGFVPGFGTTTEPKSYSFIDENVSAGSYQYRLKQIDFDGTFEYSNTVDVEITSPTEFSLEQNYPNPFNPSTAISFSIPERSFVTLKVYDILGREVAELINEELETGRFEKTFEANNLASGVYIYRITSMNEGRIFFNESKQMLLIK